MQMIVKIINKIKDNKLSINRQKFILNHKYTNILYKYAQYLSKEINK